MPLVTVLRDTLGDKNPENDRVSYVWLLSYVRPNLGQRLLSAVPFFYWRVTDGPKSLNEHGAAPLLNVTAPQHPVVSEIGRNILQWTMLDPMTTPVRATSRAYRSNESDDERLHLEEAINYLRNAPVGDKDSELTEVQLDTILARLELRKRLLGGFVSERRAAQLGQEDGFEQERIRSRNWELLRQCAEKTGLLFEPLNLGGREGQYAVVWFPLGQAFESSGASLTPIWKLLNLKNPWDDARLKQWHGRVYERSLDENGSLLPPGATGSQPVRLVPLGVYSLNYPRLPLLLVDFRDTLHVRRHEMTQRTINEITSGVIGISHFTNWYYYVAADLYDFIKARHGAAMNQAARLDCYSQFRVELALDHSLDPVLREQMRHYVHSLAINPLQGSPDREIELAKTRFALLQADAQEDGDLAAQLDKDRRAELAEFGENRRARILGDVLHEISFGLYTHRVRQQPDEIAALDRDRRIRYQLSFLDSLADAGTQPEIAYDSSHIHAALIELSDLMAGVKSPTLRAHVGSTVARVRELSRDTALQADCSQALVAVNGQEKPSTAAVSSGLAASTNTVASVGASLDAHK